MGLFSKKKKKEEELSFKEETEEKEEAEEEQISDVFDLLDKIGIKVHTKGSKYNKDHVLSNLTENERKFVREQIKLSGLIKDWFADKKFGKKAGDVLQTDIDGVIILSRAKQGMMLKAVVKAVTGEHPEALNPLQKESGFFNKLFGKR